MASASAKAPEQSPVEMAAGPYRVASTLARVQTEGREELHNLTAMVRDFVRTSGVRSGCVIVSSLHTTCGIFINEWQDALVQDVKAYIQGLVDANMYFRHNDPALSDCDRHNADSHLRSLLLGSTLTFQIADGEIVLGEWQAIILAELDGPRERTVRLQATGVASS